MLFTSSSLETEIRIKRIHPSQTVSPVQFENIRRNTEKQKVKYNTVSLLVFLALRAVRKSLHIEWAWGNKNDKVLS